MRLLALGGGLTAPTFRALADQLEPVMDGLLPDGPPQCWRLKG
jgi:hypothetical protein